MVTKLFAIAGPCVAVFGRKDYQQLRVITRVVADLFLPVEIVGLRTVREPDGLAMSSRNAYLTPDQRAAALALPRGLSLASGAFQRGERDAGALAAIARAEVGRDGGAETPPNPPTIRRDGGAETPPSPPIGMSIDYVDVADPSSLRVLGPGDRTGRSRAPGARRPRRAGRGSSTTWSWARIAPDPVDRAARVMEGEEGRIERGG